MSVTAEAVRQLRERTAAGMMECKRALVETNGDLDAAAELMRKQGLAKADKKASRVAAEGVIVTAQAADGKAAVMVEINCETDFVARESDFQGFAALVGKLVLKHKPADLDALLALKSDAGTTVDEQRRVLIAKIGENIGVRRFTVMEAPKLLGAYLHGTRIGVLVEFDGADEQVGKDVAMHIAAMKPVSLSSDQVPADLIEKERSVAALKAQEDANKATAEGKSPHSAEIVAKRIDGSVQKFLKEVSLLNQTFVKNDKQTVEQMLKAANASVKSFTMYVVGEGIEKKQDDFAAEVAAQVAAAKQA